MPASEIHQRYITTPFDDLSQPFWCKRRAIVVQGRMQPVVHRPRAKSDVTLTRCSVACRDLLGGAGIETLGVRRLVFAEGPMDFAGSTQVAYRAQTNSTRPLSIGVMIAGNSGRPCGAIYAPWFASLAKRLQGVHPGHWAQRERILAAWLVGSERTAPHQLLAERDQLRTETLKKWNLVSFIACITNGGWWRTMSKLSQVLLTEMGLRLALLIDGLTTCVRDGSQQGRGWTTCTRTSRSTMGMRGFCPTQISVSI